MSGLTLAHLTVHTGLTTLLDDVSFTAPPGTVTGLIGPNGAGKSTLIGASIGLRPVTAGTIHFAGHDLLHLRPAERAKLVAHVEQSATTTERLVVRDVVALGRIPYQSTWQSAPSPADEAITDAALGSLDLQPFAHRLYHSLSGGEQQRVQLARALAQAPQLLLLDEPTSHLDIAAQLRVLALLRQQASAGRTVLIALHDLNLAARFCDHLVLLDRGKVAAAGPPATVLTPELLRAVYGVTATITTLPGRPWPLVIFEDASAPKAD